MKDLQKERDFDEVLEMVWICREESRGENLDFILGKCEVENPGKILEEMEGEGLIKKHGKAVDFTETGEKQAQGVIRRHRLAEVLFHEVFAIKGRAMESNACRFEHVLSPELTEAVCSFLGHPPICPHRKKIPAGECCKVFKKEVSPLITRLTNAAVGARLKIAFIHTDRHSQMERLMAFGVTAGKEIRLHQKKPSYIIRIGQTDLAVDKEIAGNIYVRNAG